MAKSVKVKIDGIPTKEYMINKYKDICFDIAYCSRIIGILNPILKKRLTEKEVYDDILNNSVDTDLSFLINDIDDCAGTTFADDIIFNLNEQLKGVKAQHLSKDYIAGKKPSQKFIEDN